MLDYGSFEEKTRSDEELVTPFYQDGRLNAPAIRASDLQGMKLRPTQWLVRDILPQGAAVLAAGSKVGKSWLALDLAVSVASGRQFLGHDTVQAGVLYLALEDSFNRLQDRLQKMLDGSAAPEDLELMTVFANMDDGFDTVLRDYISRGRENVKLVIVDTLQRVRGSGKRGESLYAQDYRELSMLKELADELKICMLFVHHNRKMPDETDPFNLISGSTGIMGVCDTIWVITKESRKSEKATLHVTGRDVLQESTVLRFDTACYRWQALGDRESVELQERETAWRRNILGSALRRLVTACGGHWEGSASMLHMSLYDMGVRGQYNGAQGLASQLKKISDNLEKYEGIVYTTRQGEGHVTLHSFSTADYRKFDGEAQIIEENLFASV